MSVDITSLTDLTVWALANMADTLSPDTDHSAGAEFLKRIRNSVVEHVERVADESPEYDADDIRAYLEDEISSIADDAPSIYTHERFVQLVDLGAYREDVSELGFEDTDMEKQAGVALYMVAERLVNALLESLGDTDD